MHRFLRVSRYAGTTKRLFRRLAIPSATEPLVFTGLAVNRNLIRFITETGTEPPTRVYTNSAGMILGHSIIIFYGNGHGRQIAAVVA